MFKEPKCSNTIINPKCSNTINILVKFVSYLNQKKDDFSLEEVNNQPNEMDQEIQEFKFKLAFYKDFTNQIIKDSRKKIYQLQPQKNNFKSLITKKFLCFCVYA